LKVVEQELLMSTPLLMGKIWLHMMGICIYSIWHPDHTDGSVSLAPENRLTKTPRHCQVSGNVHLRKWVARFEIRPCDSDSPTENDSKKVEHLPNTVV
jgi:hypothetical protein